MEMKEAERVAISKPVASRPTCSTFRSFSELLAGAINSSPPRVDTETTIAAIRPKTVRFKPTVYNAPTGMVPLPLQPELCEAPTCQPSDLRSESKSTVVYKPLAKVVSKATVSFLANMGDFNNGSELAPTSVESPVHCSNEDQNQIRPHFLSNIHQNFSPQTETDQITEPSMMASQNVVEDQKCSLLACNGDRPSYDGYNWRKYGQKQVKGSEYPRSYYKCTHPNCPVKKKVERSFDGQIAEIVYKGEHNHSKPQLAKRNTSGTQGHAFASSDRTGQDSNSQLCASAIHINERNEGSEGRIENQSEQGVSSRSAYPSKTIVCSDPGTNGAALSAGYETKTDNFCGRSGDGDELNKGNDAEDEEPKRKRRKSDNQSIEAGTSGIVLEEPNVVVQSPNETEVITDGFRWRKYGQKVVKGNLYPRSYYRCTSLRCNVRKHVERALDDPRAFITTYEGKHNHEMPIKSTNQVVAEPETHTSTHKDKA